MSKKEERDIEKKKRVRMRNASIISVLIFSAMMLAAYFVAISAR